MARLISTTVRLDEEDVRALKRARAAGHSTSDLIRKGLRLVASALGRLGREGRLSEDQRSTALASLTADASSVLIVELTGEVVARVQVLTQKHAARLEGVKLPGCRPA